MPKTYEKISERGTITVTKHYNTKRTKEEVSTENLEVQTFDTDPARIRTNVGFTINLGNYESGRVDVSVELPTYVEEIPDALERAEEIAGKKSAELVEAVREFAKRNLGR
jgi:hypothetical protein